MQGSSMLYHLPEFHSFLWLNNIPLHVYTTFCLFICWWIFRLFPPFGCFEWCSVNLQSVFHSSCPILHSHQQCTMVLISLHPGQQLLLCVFLIVILVGVKGYLTVVLICISLMTNNVEHHFMCLLAICMTSLEKCLFKSLVHIRIRLFAFLCLSYELFLYSVLITYQIYDL